MSEDKVLEAVDALAVELGIGLNGLAFTWDQLEALNGILAAHAHELAEKIRQEIKDPNPLASIFRPFAGTLAADLIDSHVGADCAACGELMDYVDCPTGGWWAHRVHPSDEHDAMRGMHA